MFNISPEILQEKSPAAEYKRGSDYFRSGRIKSVQYNQETNSFSAVVMGTRNHTVHIAFDDEGNLQGADCSCQVFESAYGLCRHAVSVMLLISERDKQGFFRQLRFRQAAKRIFSLFQPKPSLSKSPVRLVPIFEYSRIGRAHKAATTSISFKIGIDRLYIIKDVKIFMSALERGGEITFGKNFTFDPSMHCFEPSGRQLVEFLKELYENENLLNELSAGTTRGSVFRGKQVFLTDTGTKRFFEFYQNSAFDARINGTTLENTSIVRGDIPVVFNLEKENNDLILSIDYEGTLIPLTEDGEYFFSGDRIYRVSEHQRENLKPFYMAILLQKSRNLRFIEEDKERFVSEILPFAEKAGTLQISEKVQSLIEKLDLSAEIYIDKTSDYITAELKFIYGERIINPFSAADKNPARSDKILLRDIPREEAILDLLEQSSFKVKNGLLYLDEDEKIYDFVLNTVPRLAEYSSIFYSDSFRNLTVRNSFSYSGKVRLNNDTGMLEIDFDFDGIDRSELIEIMGSLRQHKKYYRLKDGSLLSLNSPELRKLASLFGQIGLEMRDLQESRIEIPKYRAMYLDQSLRDLEMSHLERSHAFKEFVQNVIEPTDMEFSIPPGLTKIMREYQKFGFKWLKTLSSYKLGGILADDMGLGKTLQIISLIVSDKQEKGPSPSLIIVPTSLVYNWCSEIDKFAPELEYKVIVGAREERRQLLDSLHQTDLIITTYPLIRRDFEHYTGLTFRYIVLDEAQHIKNPGSLNAYAVKKLHAENRFAMTGTPIENNLSELWSIFDFIMPGYLFSFSKFSKDYIATFKDEDYDQSSNLSKQIKPFILRRLKKDVLHELPEKIEHRMVAELTEEQKKLYAAYLMDAKGELDREIEHSGFEKNRIRIFAVLTRLRQLCCHPSLFIENYQGKSGKMLLLQELVSESIEGGHRLLIFSQFTSMLSIIRSWLESEHIGYSYLDGSTPIIERGKLVKAFNEGSGKVFLISLKAGGTGLNLTGADTVIHYDPWWNPAVEDQATDRAYRIGQNKSVHVIKLVTKGTIEEKIADLQERKKALIDAVIQPGETLVSKLTREEIEELFRM